MKALAAISQIEQLVKLALENTDILGSKGTPRSIRFPAELDERVNSAMRVLSGCDRTEIVVRCVEKSLNAVVSEMVEERERRAKDWRSGSPQTQKEEIAEHREVKPRHGKLPKLKGAKN